MQDEKIDAHLRAGGAVVAASDRAARALRARYDEARRAEGLQAWAAPRVRSWAGFVHEIWEEYSDGSLLPLNAAQERALWEQVIAASGHTVGLLEPARRRTAAMAMRAHALLCTYAPRYLNARNRRMWDQDAAAFSGWMEGFDELCGRHGVMSAARLAHAALPLLERRPEDRPGLLVTGFDRLLPLHSALLNAWGEWKQVHAEEPAGSTQFYAAEDAESETAACARWCRIAIGKQPDCKLLVIAPDVRSVRGELERALYREAAVQPELRFEFSLGVPLSQTGPGRSAELLLRALDGELAEHEVDWLFSSGYAAGGEGETAGLLAGMRNLRRKGYQRTRWSVASLLQQDAVARWPEAWKRRVASASEQVRAVGRRAEIPTEWVEFATKILKALGWPGDAGAGSTEYQATDAVRDALTGCGSLGFDGRRMTWREFLGEVRVEIEETIFAPESESAQVLITGPAESAGIRADAIWFLGADEEAWPARGNLDPLIPAAIQRETGMPHASVQDDWEVGVAMTRRLLASAGEVCFSYPRQREGVEMRGSRLAEMFAGPAVPLPNELRRDAAAPSIAEGLEDVGAISYRPAAVDAEAGPIPLKGGAGLLTAQSQCPFKAFAKSRLDAQGWEAAEMGLTPPERGKILHAVMRSVWSGRAPGIRTWKELQAIADLREFANQHVRMSLEPQLPPRAKETMPARYLELEGERLTRLVAEWLGYEKTRIEFEVMQTEEPRTRTVAGISLKIQFDRVDRLNDGTVLVVDYKTGNVSVAAWDVPRPDDVQLPLYAGFGLDEDEPVGGLVFAKVKPGEMCFAGRVGDAAGTLHAGLKANSALVKNALTLDYLEDWRKTIEKLARDFLAGRPDVDPRDPAKTCSRCDLHAVCRIREREVCVADEGEDDDE